jgi:hypothetical protein
MAANAAKMKARTERRADEAAIERMSAKASHAIARKEKKEKYAVRGARIYCDCGSHFQRFNLPVGARPLVNGEPMMCETDNVCNENFFPFGVCGSAANRSEGIVEYPAQSGAGIVRGKPCSPIILAPWCNAAPKVFLDGKKALRTDSYLICAQGGFIRFLDDGQPERIIRESDPEDIVAIQIRLVALGLLKPQNVKWGKYDKKTEEAVIKFQEGFLPKSKATGDIDDETWEKLGLRDTPATISSPGYESPEAKEGRMRAQDMLDRLIFNPNQKEPLLVLGNFSYAEFTYQYTYANKLWGTVRDKELVGTMTSGVDVAYATAEHYREFMSSTPYPLAELAGAFLLSVYEEAAGIESFVDTSTVLDTFMEQKVQDAFAEFSVVENSPLAYTFDAKYVNHESSLIKNAYIAEVAKLTSDIASEKITPRGDYDAELVRSYAMDYLMRVAYLNTAPRESQAFLDNLLKKK